MYKIQNWIDETKLNKSLSINERAVEYLENHEYLIDDRIFLNVNAIHIIEKRIQDDKRGFVNNNKNVVNFLRNNRQYIDYNALCYYEHGIEFVDELIKNNQLDKINWCRLSKNPAAMHILNDPKYYTYLDWHGLLYNKNAGELVKNNLHMVEKYWSDICTQASLIDIIEQNMDKIDWPSLSYNYKAIHILEKNMDKINIDKLCLNKNGFNLLLQLNHNFNNMRIAFYNIHIVFEYFDYCEKNNIQFKLIRFLSQYGYTKKHMDFLRYTNNYDYLSMNPNIFEYDYKRMRETRQALLWYNDIKK